MTMARLAHQWRDEADRLLRGNPSTESVRTAAEWQARALRQCARELMDEIHGPGTPEEEQTA